MFDQGCLTFYLLVPHISTLAAYLKNVKKKKELKNSNNGMIISGFCLEYVHFKIMKDNLINANHLCSTFSLGFRV